MIKSCCQRDQVISYDHPQTQAALEVRPRIRSATTPAAPTLTPPLTRAILELKPRTEDAVAPAPPSPDPRPESITAQELRPITKKVEKS